MIQIFLWKFHGKNVGHLSMALSNGTYISFWPNEDLQLKRKKNPASLSYEDDEYSQGRPADNVLELPDDIVDQEKIKVWWSDYVDHNKYHLLTNNCALVVQQALLVGGIFQSGSVGDRSDAFEVFEWAKACKRLYPMKQDNSIAAQVFRGVRDYFQS